jgi:GTPase Era involved in 16S rRNA processing
MALNENHQRHLLSTFQYVDNLLSEAERIMASAGSASPFQEYSQDTTPIQRKVTHDYIVRVREAMRCILEELKIPLRPPISGALWAARGHLSFAGIAIAEIAPEHMRGYGQFSEDDARTMDSIVAELNAGLSRITEYLAQGATTDLQARLLRLEQTRSEVKLLRELERIITAHGLVEFRNALVTLLDRLETTFFEIGVFGRVSSGKSSLLNHLLEQDVLPVGVTPVTAVPTRISFGPQPHATIEFAEGKPQEVELSRLAEFSTEQQNPANAKHVTRIQVLVPARRLREGVTFVDTPGLGSLATTGAEETVAYLPKCDLGIVLLDAGSALSHEDLVVVQSLCRAGATAMVLISKADLLGPPDRQRMADYVRQHLFSEVKFNLPVHLVSVVGADAQLCEEWFESELKPMLESHREAASASLKRKIGLLREAVMDALRVRLDAARSPTGRARHSVRAGEDLRDGGAQRTDAPYQEIDSCLKQAAEALRGASAILESAEKEGQTLGDNTRGLAPSALQAVATDIASAWLKGTNPAPDVAGIFSASLNRFLAQVSAAFVQSVEEVRARLTATLEQAHAASGSRRGPPEELPKAAGLPIMDSSPLAARLTLRKPHLLSLLGRRTLRRFAESKISGQLEDSLAEFFNLAGKRLEQWHNNALAELCDAFDARAGIYRAVLAQGQRATAENASEADVRRDLFALENWESP